MKLFYMFLFFLFSQTRCLQTVKRMSLTMRSKNIRGISLPFEPTYIPKTENQKKYVEYLNDKQTDMIVCVGPAGTGKTLFACLHGINLMKAGLIHKIILTRPVVSVDEDIGFLPGNLVKKMDPWTRPIMDIFSESYSKAEIDNMIFNNVIEISPLAYMRGRTFKNAFVIADEMQNSSPNQMLMLATRIGVNSKVVVTGDMKQSDKMENNGLAEFIQKYETYQKNSENESNLIKYIQLSSADIERSRLVEHVINMYDFSGKTDTEKDNKKNIDYTIKSSKIYKNDDAALMPLTDIRILDKYLKP